MDYTVFYAWQSDTPTDTGRYLIRDALADAVKTVARDGTIEDSPRLDHDTKGLPGTPEIAASIFEKISSCGVFVADLSFVGEVVAADGRRKRVPNPNVMLELGFAASVVGWARVVGVMNEAHGAATEMIFDLQHRRHPITYTLNDPTGRKATRETLSRTFVDALRSISTAPHEAAKKTLAQLDTYCLEVLFANAHQTSIPILDSEKTFGGGLGSMQRHLAWRRLLELGVVRTIRPTLSSFAYEWTHHGRLVLHELVLKFASREELAVLTKMDGMKKGDSLELTAEEGNILMAYFQKAAVKGQDPEPTDQEPKSK